MVLIEQIAEASKATTPYDIISFKGVNLLVSSKKLKDIIQRTYELTHDESIKELAHSLGIELRYKQVENYRRKINHDDNSWKQQGRDCKI